MISGSIIYNIHIYINTMDHQNRSIPYAIQYHKSIQPITIYGISSPVEWDIPWYTMISMAVLDDQKETYIYITIPSTICNYQYIYIYYFSRCNYPDDDRILDDIRIYHQHIPYSTWCYILSLTIPLAWKVAPPRRPPLGDRPRRGRRRCAPGVRTWCSNIGEFTTDTVLFDLPTSG